MKEISCRCCKHNILNNGDGCNGCISFNKFSVYWSDCYECKPSSDIDDILKELYTFESYEPKNKLTCDSCSLTYTCEYAYDPYNTDGDCLAIK